MLSTFFNVSHTGRYTIASELLINDQITDKELRVIGSHGQQIGILSPTEALHLAE